MKIMNCFFLTLVMMAVTVLPAQASPSASNEETSQQHNSCLKALDQYFTHDVPVEQLRRYLNAQFEVTAYRLLASMLAQREEQQSEYRQGKRTEKAIPRYSLQVKAHIEAQEKEVGDDPQFLEAKRSFESDPLSISTLAKLAPFIERSIVKHSRIYDNDVYTAHFRLDEADFKMLNFLAYVEKNRRNPLPRTTFVNYIENYEQGFLDAMEKNVNLYIVDEYSIQEAQRFIESFWGKLKLPTECTGDDAPYSFRQRNGAVTQALFDSMLKREDMKMQREERSHKYVFHTGHSSPSRWAEDADIYPGDPDPE
ncbi:MAG: hypothetical protein KKD73_02680 [Proteobacteria bacterium]|nr:hypothetical protein [Pseudomonadota bacterium]MBU1640498.1 hypothetical protein [Pseudomonadota bacterium]